MDERSAEGEMVRSVSDAMAAIDARLSELGAPGWASTVRTLVDNLSSGCERGSTVGIDPDGRSGSHETVSDQSPLDASHPATEVLAILRAIDADAPERVQLELFARRFARLRSFFRRARKTDASGRPVLWNPLRGSLSEFASGGSEVHRYEASAPYPPDDQIQAWVYAALERGR